MLRFVASVSFAALFTASLAACGGEPLCGVDELGEDVPICTPDLPGSAEVLEFCPGDHWSNPACESCSCTPQGEVKCSAPDPECVPEG